MKEEKSFFKLMQKVPGGLIIVPMLIGVLANTFIPNVLEIGGFTSGMFKTGTACLLGMFLLLNGASIDVKKIGMPLYKGCTLTLMKFVVGIVLGLLVAKIGGAAGFCGITSMAMIAGITNSAGGLYLGLAQQYGDETDAGAISILSLNDGPFFTMIAMGTAGMASIPIESFIATLIPLIIGIIWGNLDKTFRKVAADAMPIITFFMMIPIGAGMSLKSIALGGVGGVVLAIISALSAFLFYFLFQLTLPKNKRNAMGAAIGTTAANATSVPASLAEVDPAWQSAASTATAQLISIGGLDFVDFSTSELPDRMGERKYMLHNANTAHIKILPEEAEALGKILAERLSKVTYPVKLLIPTKGMRHNTLEGQELYEPKSDSVLIQTIIENVNDNVEVIVIPHNLDTPEFGVKAAHYIVDEMKKQGKLPQNFGEN